jgi:hypothetical protein
MAYAGQTFQILTSACGFMHSFNVDAMPPTALVDPTANINMHKGGISKRGGTAYVNAGAYAGAPKITGIHDFYKRSGTHYVVVSTNGGKFYAAYGTTTIASGYTADKYTSAQVVGDAIYIANGGDLPFSYNGTSTSNVTPHSDWATVGYPEQLILHGLGNQQRLWSVGFRNGAVYYSEDGTYNDFTTDGIYINTGDGFGTVGAVEYGDRMIAFGKTQTWIIDDTDATPSNWGYQAAQWYGGAAHWRLIIRTPNDVVAMMEDGEIYSVIAAENYGDYKAASISRPAWIHNWISDYADLSKIDQFHGVYDPVLRAVRIWIVRKGKIEPDTCLVYFIDREAPNAWSIHNNPSYASGYNAYVSGVVRASTGVFSVYTGDASGIVWKLEQSSENDNSNGYYAGFRTAFCTLEDPRISKMFNRLRIITQPEGDYNLNYQIFVDKDRVAYGVVALTGTGGTLGSFVLGTDTVGGATLVDESVKIGHIGKRIQVELYNSNANQSFFISQILIDFKPMGGVNE